MEQDTDRVPSSEVFLRSIASQVNREDVYKMQDAQLHMLQRFEKTNEMLVNFNVLSSARYQTTYQDFRKHTQLLLDTKKDLENVFKRIRNLKSRLGKQHSEAFTACSDIYYIVEDDNMERNRPTRSATTIDSSLADVPQRGRAPTI